jgi:hypothetical protein
MNSSFSLRASFSSSVPNATRETFVNNSIFARSRFDVCDHVVPRLKYVMVFFIAKRSTGGAVLSREDAEIAFALSLCLDAPGDA